MHERLETGRGLLHDGLRPAASARIAFLLAWAVRLDQPQRAGMTVLACSQPLRTLPLKRSLFRDIDALVGASLCVVHALAAARVGRK